MVRGRSCVVFALLGLMLAAGCGHSTTQRAEPSRTRDAGDRTGDPQPSASTEPGHDPSTSPASQEDEVAPQRPEPEPEPPTAEPPVPPSSRVDCSLRKCVALTFDDGPGAYTGRLLDQLRAAHVHATFFLLGQNVAGHRGLVRRMVEEGHEVGNHSWSHPDLTTLPSWEVRAQVRRTQQAVQDVTGVAPVLFRPPYGAVDGRVADAVGMPLVLWSVDSLDWLHRDVRRNIIVGVRQPRRGGIVLFHDIHRPTVAAVPSVLEGLRERGFTFVTVSELFDGRTLTPGHRYAGR
ncbi:polysaccharide deacetylase family protein [Actinomadura sp. NPDC047616]|uniref:polysaccharide deacetylase family protein n=1 Tax=Actinomadura sp. NPDC047616 TaxID=3155914 RepID=UPI0033EBC20D